MKKLKYTMAMLECYRYAEQNEAMRWCCFSVDEAMTADKHRYSVCFGDNKGRGKVCFIPSLTKTEAEKLARKFDLALTEMKDEFIQQRESKIRANLEKVLAVEDTDES